MIEKGYVVFECKYWMELRTDTRTVLDRDLISSWD